MSQHLADKIRDKERTLNRRAIRQAKYAGLPL